MEGIVVEKGGKEREQQGQTEPECKSTELDGDCHLDEDQDKKDEHG